MSVFDFNRGENKQKLILIPYYFLRMKKDYQSLQNFEKKPKKSYMCFKGL